MTAQARGVSQPAGCGDRNAARALSEPRPAPRRILEQVERSGGQPEDQRQTRQPVRHRVLGDDGDDQHDNREVPEIEAVGDLRPRTG